MGASFTIFPLKIFITHPMIPQKPTCSLVVCSSSSASPRCLCPQHCLCLINLTPVPILDNQSTKMSVRVISQPLLRLKSHNVPLLQPLWTVQVQQCSLILASILP